MLIPDLEPPRLQPPVIGNAGKDQRITQDVHSEHWASV